MNRRRDFYRRLDGRILAGLGLGLALILGSLAFTVINAISVETLHSCTVTDKDRTGNTDGTSNMRVYTENCGTLKVSDSLLSWTFSSADTFSSIDEGETYDFKTRGFRVPFFSMFPNIVEVYPANTAP